MKREILRLERIVNDFLLFARPSDPELTVVPAELPLQEAQLFLAASLAGADIQLVLEKSAPMHSLHIRVDLAQIKQVLINLVQNAADSLNQGGTVTLRARADRRKLPPGETSVVILEKWRTPAPAFRRRWRNGCLIRSSPPRKRAPGWACPLRRESCKSTAGHSSIRRRLITAPPSALSCRKHFQLHPHRPPHERRQNFIDRG